MRDVIFLTGATGFLGTNIAQQLVERTDSEIVALVRAGDEESAIHRLRKSWWERSELAKEIGKRVRVQTGDLRQDTFGWTDEEFERIDEHITRIIHCAADLRLDGPIKEMRNINVGGTAQLLDLARRASEKHDFFRFLYVSTAYVAGQRNGSIPEDTIPNHTKFSNSYEKTKYEAEYLVRSAGEELPITIVRPGMVVGDSETGSITSFNTIYYPLRLYMTGKLSIFPARADHRLNIVPVDYVTESVVSLAFHNDSIGKTYHLTAPYDSLPRVDEFMRTVREWALKHLDIAFPKLVFLPLPVRLLRGISRFMNVVSPRSVKFWKNIEVLSPYVHDTKEFSRFNTDTVLGSYVLDWKKYLPNLLSFAVYHGFLNRVPRTVHEQLFARLTSTSRSVTYRDMGLNHENRRTAMEMKSDITRVCSALKSFGIGKGDRIGIIGPNSTRYLVLDIALGLLGAISVPLYSTTPARDIERMIHDSSCCMVCVGSQSILDRIQTLKLDIPIILFFNNASDTITDVTIDWESFLDTGGRVTRLPRTRVALDDVATIRYSSGTTGIPTGISYTHRQLVWMAEAVSALPPWRARIHPIRYLSFLPMNHVVEGILALYSPYYAPAPLAISFLEDFHAISKALPAIRPTVFFSVPRLYEKLWDHFVNSMGGKIYRNLHPKMRDFGIRTLIKRGLLHRAGLDRCDMLIVGSAIMDTDLLRSYQELGIEIHNAYGLTEAPLITINRYGGNHIGTVGTSLPDTDIRCDDIGQILVRGPQVSHTDSSGANTHSNDGWLPTGDTGNVEADGYLILTGRLRDTIVTSYGKNIHPDRVETLMKRIPGISEALLIGDAKPFCTAILWMEQTFPDPTFFAFVHRAMTELSDHLSLPERPKRWAIIANDLSIEDGTLTPNFKIRKRSVRKQNADIIDALYGKTHTPKRVLCIGCIDGDSKEADPRFSRDCVSNSRE